MDAATDVTCQSGQAACMGACVDTRTSAQHCGAFGRVCTSGQSCIAGSLSGCATYYVACR